LGFDIEYRYKQVTTSIHSLKNTSDLINAKLLENHASEYELYKTDQLSIKHCNNIDTDLRDWIKLYKIGKALHLDYSILQQLTEVYTSDQQTSIFKHLSQHCIKQRVLPTYNILSMDTVVHVTEDLINILNNNKHNIKQNNNLQRELKK